MIVRTLIGSVLLLQIISAQAFAADDISRSCEGDGSESRCYSVPKNKTKKFEEIRNQASEHIDQLNQKLFGHKTKKFENESNGPSLLLNERRIREHGSSGTRLPSSIRDQRNQFEEFNKPYEMPQKKDNSITYGLGFSVKLDNNSDN